MMSRPSRPGLTVIELVIVIVIVGVLLAIAIPRFTRPSLDVVAAPDSVVTAGASGPLSVRVTNFRGSPQVGVPVEFRASGGAGTITPARATTDSTGVATATWTAGSGAGTASFSASVAGRDEPRVSVTTRVNPAGAAPTPAPAQPNATP